MTTNFKQTGNDLEQYLIPLSNKDVVPLDKRKSGGPWGSWGALFSSGRGDNYGELGLNSRVQVSSPTQIGSLTTWKLVSAGYYHTASIDTSGKLWTWGKNNNSQLGLGDTSNYSSPVQVGSLTNWNQVIGGTNHTIAIKTDGTLWTWGSGSPYGQLGLGDTSNYSSPVQVGTLTNWKTIFRGSDRTIAIKTDGTLWIWGSDSYGSLGLGTSFSNKSSPVQVGTLTNWKQASDGYDSVLAVKTDGTLWAWGFNNYGQLGLNNITSRSSPVQVGTSTDWAQVSCTWSGSSFAVKTDGTLWAWGGNSTSNLGLNDSAHRSSPTQIGSLTNWSRVIAGTDNAVAIKTDGTLWAWGYNYYGQLGLGDRSGKGSPVQLGSLTNWIDVSSGRYHRIFIAG